MNTITRTIKSNQGNALVFNLDTNQLEREQFTFAGVLDDKVTAKISKVFEHENKRFIKFDNVTTVEQVYELDESTFLAHAHVVTSRNSAVRMVSKNIKATNVNVLVFNLATNALETLHITISGTPTDKTSKELAKLYDNSTYKYIKFDAVGLVENVYGMTETEFLKLAHPCDKRNK